MARRKEDKLRPYRVDYFDIDQMIDNDRALIRSAMYRALTAVQAAEYVLTDTSTLPAGLVEGRIIIRAYRYYKKLGQPKRNVYKAIEDLFTSNKAVKIMEQVEAYRKRKETDAQFAAAYAPVDATIENNGHQTRFSDSSLYDEVCINCGGTDGRDGGLDRPCPNAPTTGPNSPATKAVVADLAGMIAHDEHEQAMDTFIPNVGQPDISKFDLDAAAPIINPASEDLPYTDSNHVCTDKCYDFVPINDPMSGPPDLRFPSAPVMPTQPAMFDCVPSVDRVMGGEPMSLVLKLVLFGGISFFAIIIVLAILHCGK
jgi:hypothetical protein